MIHVPSYHVSPERENHHRSTGNWFTCQSSTEVEAPITVPVQGVPAHAGPGRADPGHAGPGHASPVKAVSAPLSAQVLRPPGQSGPAPEGSLARPGGRGTGSPSRTHPYHSDRRCGSRRSHHRSASPPSSDSSEYGSDASRRGRRHYGGHHSRRDAHEGRSAAVGQEQLLTILSDVQRRLAAVERPTSPCPSSPAPQEEMEIMDLPSEAADDFSSEEENEEWGTPTLTEATVSEPPSTTTPRPRVAPTARVTSASSLGDFPHGEEPEWRMYRDTVNSVYRKGSGFSLISPGRPRTPHWCPRRDIPQRSKFGPHN